MKKLKFIILSFCFLLCGCTNDVNLIKTEEEKMATNPSFSNAIKKGETFVCGGVSFCVTKAIENMSPNDDAVVKTIKVYVSYPYEEKNVNYSHFSVIDVDNVRYESQLPDGLDWMGAYREEGKDGKVTFTVPKNYIHFLLELTFDNDNPKLIYFCLSQF